MEATHGCGKGVSHFERLPVTSGSACWRSLCRWGENSQQQIRVLGKEGRLKYFYTHIDKTSKTGYSPDSIYTFIRFKIVAGEYEPGYRINIKKISEIFCLSRIPVRDVINRLCGEVLVQKGPTRFIVTPLTESDIRDTYEMRGILEGYLVNRAAVNFGENDFAYLEENLKQQEEEKGNIEIYVQLNTEFHQFFFKGTTNSKFINILTTIRDYQSRFDHINWITHGLLFTNIILQQHREIFNAIKKRNGELAERMMKLHMNTGVEFLIKALRDKSMLPPSNSGLNEQRMSGGKIAKSMSFESKIIPL